MVPDTSLWNWIDSALKGNVVRAAMKITLLDQAENPVWSWNIRQAWPCKWTGPVLVAKSSDVAIETLEICHEGFEMAAAG